MKNAGYRVGAALASIVLVAMTATISALAQPAEREVPDEYPEYEFVCPDGGYQSGCDASDIERATDVESARPSDFGEGCLYRTDADCSVIANGRITRFSDGPDLYWQLLSLQPNDGPHAEMLVLAEMHDAFAYLLFAKQVEGYFDPPVAARDGDGRFLLHVPARNRGLGNEDLVLFTSGEGWNWTSALQIMSEVDRLLPDGFAIASPVAFDFREGSAFALARRDDDPGCCATGGTVLLDFEQSDHSLSVTRVRFIETMPVGREHDAYPRDHEKSDERAGR